MRSSIILLGALCAWLSPALAAPSANRPTRAIHKRATPVIGPGFTAQQTTQINDAMNNALQLASYVRGGTSARVDPIFAKYFNAGDRDTVNAVFDRILGSDSSGNSILSDLTIVVDFPDSNGDLVCDGETQGALDGGSTNNPQMIICDAGFAHGGIGIGYPNVDTVRCENFDPRVSWKMDVLGATLLHEYTHWDRLVGPPDGPLAEGTEDLAYGPHGSRQMDKSDAVNNADSYTWFALEVLWSTICQEEYEDPTPEDDEDPNCGGAVCQSPTRP